MEFPTLYHLGKNKALYSWDVWTEGDTIYSRSGQVGGQMIDASKKATPKNVGRSNATTAEEQAIKEAQAMHKHKSDRKYSLTPEEAQEEEIAPMLAQKFWERVNKNVYFPADYQHKYDGVRALARWDDGRIVLTSRGYKEWTEVTHVLDELKQVMRPGDVLDGELYYHGERLQTLMSWVKKKQPNTLKLKFYTYDMPSLRGEDSLPWLERKEALAEFYKNNVGLQHLVHVPTKPVNSEAEVYAAFDESVDDGFEGGIVRLHNGLYTYGYRSYDLLKVKAFDDNEYKVVGVTNGVGKFAKCAIWICETKEGKRFKVTPKCSQAEKERYLREADQYIGKMYTVSHAGFTEDGIPWHPVGKVFRVEEDLP